MFDFDRILQLFVLISLSLSGIFWTENPCVTGSIPVGTTHQREGILKSILPFFYLSNLQHNCRRQHHKASHKSFFISVFLINPRPHLFILLKYGRVLLILHQNTNTKTMLENTERTELSSLGEFGLIKHLTQFIEINNESTIKGIGDDAAVIDYKGKQMVVSTDMLVEGVHFDLGYVPLKHLGFKAVSVNLSDIYAMNATPKQITVSLAISNRFSVEAMEEFYAGMLLACEKHKVDIVGGDTTTNKAGLVISITAIGEANPEDLVYRNGAKEGDLLCVTGDLGGAYVGLQLLEREKRIFLETPNVQPDLGGNDYILERQLKPEARKDIPPLLKKLEVKPTSMIDISDGLASEILHLTSQSDVG